MEAYYTSFMCDICKKETILITEEVRMTVSSGGHISCSHCHSKKISKEKATDNFKECMKHSAYKKVNGAIRQVRHE